MALYDDALREKISKLPAQPGVYQYFDASGNIIYIGKAKNLKNRVLSYLNKTNQSNKTLLLVRKINDLRYIVVDTEQDALLLENNLIKKYKPRYNILLKDDKTYPWICIKKEYFPRVFITRRLVRDGSEYFGPYTSGRFAHMLMSLINSLYKLRNCNLQLSPATIAAGKFRVCLEYHIGNCLGPCVGNVSEEEYNEFIVNIRNILKGNVSQVIEFMTGRMKKYATDMQFEKAQFMKESVEALRNYQSKSTIVSTSLNNIDVFSYLEDERYAYINYLRIVHGAINQVHTIALEKKMDEDKEALFSFAIYEIRQLMRSESKEIIVPFLPDVQLSGLQYVIPKIGDKKQLLELSERNVAYFKLDKDRQRAVVKEDSKFNILKTIKTELKLPAIPHRMECFDNSNTQGTNPVASCVVFIDGKPAKREYRKFHVKTVEGPDDFASMEEIIFRRYKRVLDEGRELPDLIVIDGGKGQLHSAVNSLKKLDLYGKVPVIGLAKRMEEVYYPGDKDPYLLAKNSIALKTLMHIRDEAHRFGITFHRQLREKPLTKSELNSIKGIGGKSEEQLVRHFKSVENIKKASIAELATVVGIKKAEMVYVYFHPDTSLIS
ncbi:excinuclease ABC subunit UvrC [Culturomica massiliensis]|jgi:excinuclease ABC subunit C|uniref:excinuclease ABC subunit UvrC n=1 Tax=Culturomica massiliensis TaxID=1841857 RepID=UPI000E560BAB|nr:MULTISPECIES: excinuclease ABC subunit UvrC [Odoribacteraceae]RHV91014.1 excinuclease ABC subunit C [Odoribacter sp. OF09-27XD]